MDFVDGDIFDDPALPGVPLEGRAAYYLEAARVLARLHAQPLDGTPLAAALRTGQPRPPPPPPPVTPLAPLQQEKERERETQPQQQKAGPPRSALRGSSSGGYFARQIKRLVLVSATQAEDAPPIDGLAELAARLVAALEPANDGGGRTARRPIFPHAKQQTLLITARAVARNA